MRTGPVVERLRTECSALRQVAAAIEATTTPVFPVAWVFTVEEGAQPNSLANAHSQRLSATLAVEIVVRNAREQTSSELSGDLLEDIRDQIFAALAGWKPDDEHEPMEFARGELVAFEPGTVTWRDLWTTSRLVRAT